MRSIFLSREQVFDRPLPLFQTVGAMAAATDLVLLTTVDDGFTVDSGSVNWYLSGGDCADRFGRLNDCAQAALRPALLLEPGEEKELKNIRRSGDLATAEFGTWPTAILDAALRDMAEKQYAEGSLTETGRVLRLNGEDCPVYRLGGRQILRLTAPQGGATG